MAGLLLELRRQLARNRRQTTYHKPNVYTLEPQNERHVTETVKETTKENKLSEEIPEETQAGSIHERNVGVVSKEDFFRNVRRRRTALRVKWRSRLITLLPR